MKTDDDKDRELMKLAIEWCGLALVVALVCGTLGGMVFMWSSCERDKTRAIHCAEFRDKPTPPECR